MPRRIVVLSLLLALPLASWAGGTVVTLDGLSAKTPADWKEGEATKLRFKVFSLPGKDAGDAELVIFYFGEGGGGGTKANIERWKQMFRPPTGKDIDDVSKVTETKAGSVDVVRFEVTGTYLYKPNPMAEKVEPRKDHKMVAIIYQSPKGPYFIRLVGPETTVNAHLKGFDSWLNSFK
jgi:hypothetical protein